MFNQLEEINSRPKPFEFYTASDLWTDEYISKQMLSFHLNGEIDVSSRKFSFIDRSVDWIISRFDIREGKSVADFGCGPGLYTERLAKTNAAITGIDFSKNSIEYARKRAKDERLNINYVHQNYLEFNSDDKYDLITMIFCDFCALSPEQRKSLLEKFRFLLKPNGSILLDAYLLNAFDQKVESVTLSVSLSDGFWSSGKYYCFVNTFKYDDVNVTLVKYTIIKKNRTRQIFNWLQYYTKESIAEEFAQSGLKIEQYLANVAGDVFNADEDEFAVIAKAECKGI
ncbi:MAG TPA: class I SAM-dependent methyltransferase [Anaerolineales bacterium]|nr:class I SAM-dependent methyltransferase [Anaerolineales bacterium]